MSRQTTFRKRFFFSTLFAVLFAASSVTAQSLFNYDFENDFPDYGFSYGFAGQGSADCATNIDNNSEVTSTYDVSTGPTGIGMLDASGWTVATDACYDYVGWGLGMGHLLDEANQVLTSDDLSQYTVNFDAWTTGTNFLDFALQLQFQGPATDPSGNLLTTVNLGLNVDNFGLPLNMTNTPQSYSVTLDQFSVLDGSIADWQNAPFDQTTLFQLIVEPAGSAFSVGQDDDNVLYVDNYSVSAPHTITPSGDFNGDTFYDCLDVDALVQEIVAGTNDATYDLTVDGLVNTDDLDSWRAEAGAVNLASGNPYLEGDASLDGVVDVGDFNLWNSNKFTATAAWCSGDFNADGVVDVSDFGTWNANKFTAADRAQVVPEPHSLILLLLAVCGFITFRQG